MTTLAGFPYVELRFDRDGRRENDDPVAPAGVTDLIVISHGWHQDGRDARAMYEQLLENVRALLPASDRTIGVAGVYWPSDKYADDLTLERNAQNTGAAVSVSGDDVSAVDLKAIAARTAALLDLPPEELADTALAAAFDGGAQDKLLDLLRSALSSPQDAGPDLSEEHEELLSGAAGRSLIPTLQINLGAAANLAVDGDGSPAAVVDASNPPVTGVPAVGVLSGIKSIIARVLNQAAYFELKARAGKVGRGLAQVIAEGLDNGVRLHLIGHSFGARLVTAATANLPEPSRPQSLTLLQAAFSHNSFGVGIPKNGATIDGGFRTVVADRRVKGPITITHTWNDKAVGIAYAIASAASGEIAAALRVTNGFGGAGDIHGGLGANGALRLKSGEGTPNDFTGAAPPTLQNGHVHSLKCDFIQNHGDITGPGTARIVVAALG